MIRNFIFLGVIFFCNYLHLYGANKYEKLLSLYIDDMTRSEGITAENILINDSTFYISCSGAYKELFTAYSNDTSLVFRLINGYNEINREIISITTFISENKLQKMGLYLFSKEEQNSIQLTCSDSDQYWQQISKHYGDKTVIISVSSIYILKNYYVGFYKYQTAPMVGAGILYFIERTSYGYSIKHKHILSQS